MQVHTLRTEWFSLKTASHWAITAWTPSPPATIEFGACVTTAAAAAATANVANKIEKNQNGKKHELN